VRMVVEGGQPGQAALGTVLAAEIYGATVLREGVQDRDDNETRFVWLARGEDGAAGDAIGVAPADHATAHDEADGAMGAPPLREQEGERWKTSLVFWGPGADSPGWLVRCLDEFGRRAINLTKIESRPKRDRMGSYMFFVDLQGAVSDPAIAEAVTGLQRICEQARVLGSYRMGSPRIETTTAAATTAAATTAERAGGNRNESSTPPLHSGATDG
jgi:prephenate dehydratase